VSVLLSKFLEEPFLSFVQDLAGSPDMVRALLGNRREKFLEPCIEPMPGSKKL